jgi:hypothetical protein
MGSSGMRNAQPEPKQSRLYDEVLTSISTQRAIRPVRSKARDR